MENEKNFDINKTEVENPLVRTVKLSQEIEYNGEKISEITFDFGRLTGADAIAIENEIEKKGKVLLAPAISVDYNLLLLTRASRTRIGSDFFGMLPLADFNRVRGLARSFLLA